MVAQSPEVAVLWDERDEEPLLEFDTWANVLSVAPDVPLTAENGGERYIAIRNELPFFRVAPRTPIVEGRAVLTHTPDVRTVEQLVEMFLVGPERMIKSLVLLCTLDRERHRPVICAVPGDHDLDIGKVGALLGASSVRLATSTEVRDLTGSAIGFAGPFATEGVPDVIFDVACSFDHAVICGKHVEDYHLVGARMGGDIPSPAYVFDIAKRPVHDQAGGMGFRVLWLHAYYDRLVDQLVSDAIEPTDRPFNIVLVPARPGDLDNAKMLAARIDEFITNVHVDDRGGSFGSRIIDWELLAPAATVVIGRRYEERRVEVVFGSGQRMEMHVDRMLDELTVRHGVR